MGAFILFLACIAIIVLFIRLASLEKTVERLNKKLDISARQAPEKQESTAPAAAETKPKDPPQPEPKPTVQAHSPAGQSRSNATPRPESARPVRPQPTHVPQQTAVGDAIDKCVDLVKQYFTGGNLIVRVGVIVLFVGVAFLLQYANQHSMLPVELKVAGVALLGLALLVLGWRLRGKRTTYALVMQGGGIGVLYLTLFAALRLYELMPAGWVFAFLLLMVVLSAALAVLQNARSLAVLAISGGFLAPVLTSTGGGSHIGLFSFYAVLNVGILAIAWFKSWRLLNVLGFVFTFVIGTAWGVTSYEDKHFLSAEVFLIIFFLFYVVLALLFARQQPPKLKGYVDGTLVFGVPVVAFALQTGLVQDIAYGLAWSSFALGSFYIVLASQCWRFGGQAYRLLSEAFLALGVVFVSLTVPFALDGEWVATSWALEGAALVWISVRQQRRLGTAFGILLQVGAGIGFLAEANFRHADWAVLNSVFLGACFVALAGLFSSYYLSKHYGTERRWEKYVAILALVWGLAWWFINGIIEIERYVDFAFRWPALVLFIALSAAALGLLEWRLRWAALRYTVIGLAVAMTILALIAVFDLSHPFVRYGFLVWPVIFGVFYALLYQRDRALVAAPATQFKALPFLHALGLWLAVLLLTAELNWLLLFKAGLAAGWLTASEMLVLVVAMWTAMRSSGWPWRQHRPRYLTLAIAPLALASVLWSLFANPGSTGVMSPLPYLPLLNPLDIMQLLVVLTLLGWWRSTQQHQITFLPGNVCWATLAAIVFVALNAVLLRSLHHWFDIAYNLQALSHSLLVQACISVFWTIIGLTVMVIAARQHWRTPWIVAASLLGVVVVKLFLVDLGGRDALESIVSFIAVGLLLLVVGYFSPLPPKPKEEKQAV